MHHLKKFVLYTIMALCAFSLLLFVIPTDKMSLGSRNTPKVLKSYMKSHHINGVMLVSGKDGKPIVVENNETATKGKIVKANQLFPTASLQKNYNRGWNLSTSTKKAAQLEYSFI